MKFVRKLPDADELKEKYGLSNSEKKKREETVDEIKKILDNKDGRKLLIVGPCSADREDAVLRYMELLAGLKEAVSEKFLIIPRIYTSKPRTTGRGYKGLVHRPNPAEHDDDIYGGILAMRKMHLHVIQQTGLFGADEMLYPEAHYYISDLLAYTAVGARSVEDQQHRLVSSGLDMPVGMKNPTSGDMHVLMNAIVAAESGQTFLYHGFECASEGNKYAHAILRGYADTDGRIHSNYHFEEICDLYDLYKEINPRTHAVIIDCNHGNSRKHYDEQVRIGKEVIKLCEEYKSIDSFVKGLMVESYLVDGSQMAGENVFGKSITDPCLGWDKTERFIKELAE
ncbi:MAG: 3-deoxy-7-phosphoheptulonate synthase [Lachnospiraceae bacterium]|nr:3-deoxy-7-phosphoheptulonate synthase [Lachnospiraceae bacterium]